MFRRAGRHCLPPQPISFFVNIYEHIIRPGLGFYCSRTPGFASNRLGDLFRFGKNALYKFGASDKKFQELRANNLVMWQGIQFLVRTGAEKLHFGRNRMRKRWFTTFKLSWGTEEETIGYFRVDPSGRHGLAPARLNSGFQTRSLGSCRCWSIGWRAQ